MHAIIIGICYFSIICTYRIDSKGNIKVADFGLAEDVYTTGYFRENDGGVKLPFKWMAPESLNDGVFTEKTDVVRLDTSNND